MTAPMTSTPGAAPRRTLRRDPANGWIAGVSAGLARELGVDPLVARVGFVAATLAGGVGIAVYVLAWVLLPAASQRGGPLPTTLRGGRAAAEVSVGVGLLVLSVLLTFRELGLWFSDTVAWPLVLVAAGGALIWRQTLGGPRPEPAPAEHGAPPRPDSAVAAPRAADASRTGLGVALVIAAGVAFLQATGSLDAARDVVLATLVVAVVIGVIFAPWVVRLVRSLTAERAERIRSQERAEMAAHLHDSVLQTLALVQKRADDPRAVATLARRQERELRTWLNRRAPDADREDRLANALERAAEEVEDAHGVPIEVVAVGDADLDDAGAAVVAAAREAMQNASKFGGDGPVDVYAEVTGERIEVFVRDRGPGFDLSAVPDDRRGVRESIVGRMQRHGGRAEIRSEPGAGTEVELVVDRKAAAR
jgi:phage shock protein PspC (stress-responsive transcriptional regulator)/signal transduction histidine kinase